MDWMRLMEFVDQAHLFLYLLENLLGLAGILDMGQLESQKRAKNTHKNPAAALIRIINKIACCMVIYLFL